MHRAGLIRDLQAFVMEKADCGVDFQKICESCMLANVSMERGKNYLRFFDGRDGLTLETAPQFWLDYLTAAKLLRYDLKRDDVRMPKNLLDRHNDAMNTAAIQKDAKLMKKYSFRFVALAAQFEFSEDGLMIVVPRCPGDIITEGKSLHHCVGGYTDRHMRGEVTILFLRKKKNPIAPYVTIEMSTENNCKDLRIVQIHGFKNDLGRDSPRKTQAMQPGLLLPVRHMERARSAACRISAGRTCSEALWTAVQFALPGNSFPNSPTSGFSIS